MNYSAFEKAAAEANLGAREVETQMEQLRAQMEQLKGKRDLLRTLSHQLSILRSENGTTAAAVEPPQPSAPERVPLPAAEAATPEPPAPDSDPELARARAGWFVRRSDAPANGSDSSIRSRL